MRQAGGSFPMLEAEAPFIPSLVSLSLVAEGSCGFGAGQRLFLLSLQAWATDTHDMLRYELWSLY